MNLSKIYRRKCEIYRSRHCSLGHRIYRKSIDCFAESIDGKIRDIGEKLKRSDRKTPTRNSPARESGLLSGRQSHTGTGAAVCVPCGEFWHGHGLLGDWTADRRGRTAGGRSGEICAVLGLIVYDARVERISMMIEIVGAKRWKWKGWGCAET